MTKGETFLLYALLAAVLSPFWGFALVAMAENAVSDTPEYPHSGFCPDAPEWEGNDEVRGTKAADGPAKRASEAR